MPLQWFFPPLPNAIPSPSFTKNRTFVYRVLLLSSHSNSPSGLPGSSRTFYEAKSSNPTGKICVKVMPICRFDWQPCSRAHAFCFFRLPYYFSSKFFCEISSWRIRTFFSIFLVFYVLKTKYIVGSRGASQLGGIF